MKESMKRAGNLEENPGKEDDGKFRIEVQGKRRGRSRGEVLDILLQISGRTDCRGTK